MKHYELVLVLDAATSMDDIKKVRGEVESLIPNLLDTDDMGMIPLVSKLNGQSTAYFLSYYIQSDAAGLEAIKQLVRITRSIAKCKIFAMHASESFMKYADVKKSYELLAERDTPKKTSKTAQKKEVEVMESSDNESSEQSEETEVVAE